MSHMKNLFSDISEMIEADCSNIYIAGSIMQDYGIELRAAYDLIEEVRTLIGLQEPADFLE
jgi:hypothetical protein